MKKSIFLNTASRPKYALLSHVRLDLFVKVENLYFLDSNILYYAEKFLLAYRSWHHDSLCGYVGNLVCFCLCVGKECVDLKWGRKRNVCSAGDRIAAILTAHNMHKTIF